MKSRLTMSSSSSSSKHNTDSEDVQQSHLPLEHKNTTCADTNQGGKNKRKRRACEMTNIDATTPLAKNNDDNKDISKCPFHHQIGQNDNQQMKTSSYENPKPIISSLKPPPPPPPSSSSQDETPLTFLCLSKSWVAATNRALSYPKEAQYGCTSSARSLLPLSNNDDNNQNRNSDGITTSNSLNTNTMASSPLALVTRYGAPSYCVKAVLDAEPRMIRRCIPNRGTPLHEAIMLYPTSLSTSTIIDNRYSMIQVGVTTSVTNNSNDKKMSEYISIVRMLLKADESLEQEENNASISTQTRATLMQDVDGNVPLHLFIRQGFYHYLGEMASSEQDEVQVNETLTEHPIFSIAKELIASSPEAVSIPDCTEFEVTPLILALRSSNYANEQYAQQQRHSERVNGIDYYNSTLERNIFEICKIMLQYSPAAASHVMVGYTSVHSAVFHGRCCDTIRLLLNADAVNRYRTFSTTNDIMLPAAMQANKLGELPLHFAAMRGECTRTIALISQAAPWATLRRDFKIGLTPIHWLWVRFMDCVVERFGKRIISERDNIDDLHQDNVRNDNIHDRSENERNTEEKFSLARGPSFASATASNSLQQLHSDNDHIHFDLEYHIRTEAIDPPVQYTRMRHIIPEHSSLEDILARRVISVLRRVRARHKRLMERMMQFNENSKPSIHHDHVSKQECPFSKSVSSQRNDATIDISSKCPYAHLAPTIPNKCPYSKGMNKQIVTTPIQKSTTQKATVDISDPNKKCPFRCPFVFDSYPLNEDLLQATQQEALREEQIISLFWAKVTSLLHAAALANIQDIHQTPTALNQSEDIDYGRIHMLHTACSSPCPFAVVRLCLELHPEQVMEQDSSGKLPIHHAALRLIDEREFEFQDNEPNFEVINASFRTEGIQDNIEEVTQSVERKHRINPVIEFETLKVVQFLISSSPPDAAKTFDNDSRLPLHCSIESTVKSILQSKDYTRDGGDEYWNNVIRPMRAILEAYPDALEFVDGKTNLFPFMQASATAVIFSCALAEEKTQGRRNESIALSLVYTLLLEKPSIVNSLI